MYLMNEKVTSKKVRLAAKTGRISNGAANSSPKLTVEAELAHTTLSIFIRSCQSKLF